MRTRLHLPQFALQVSLSGRKGLPLGECGRSAIFVCLPVNEVAFGIEVIVQGCMDRREFL
jgi:hypothetical protein